MEAHHGVIHAISCDAERKVAAKTTSTSLQIRIHIGLWQRIVASAFTIVAPLLFNVCPLHG